MIDRAHLKTLTIKLQAALAADDSEAINAALLDISLIGKPLVMQQEWDEDRARRCAWEGRCIEVAKQFPCIGCGGELKHIGGEDFKCVKCKHECMRNEDLESERSYQEDLVARIQKFKQNIRLVAEIGKVKVKFNNDMTTINDKPFYVFNRCKYRSVLALEYGSRYSHESLGNQPDDWTGNLADVARECRDLFSMSWEDYDKLIVKINKLSFNKRVFKE